MAAPSTPSGASQDTSPVSVEAPAAATATAVGTDGSIEDAVEAIADPAITGSNESFTTQSSASATGVAAATSSTVSKACMDEMNKVEGGYYTHYDVYDAQGALCREEFKRALDEAIDWSIGGNYPFKGSIFNLVKDYPKVKTKDFGWTAGIAHAAYFDWNVYAFQLTLGECLFYGPKDHEIYVVFATTYKSSPYATPVPAIAIKRLTYWLEKEYLGVVPNCYI